MSQPRAQHADDGPVSARRLWFAAALLAALTTAAYAPLRSAQFIWDDDDNVTENSTLTSTAGLLRIWTDPRANQQYYPLTHTSFWIERQLFGLAPLGYHVGNVLLHAACAVLALLLLSRLRMPGALLAAALFAVHPLHVESVAWITERKNVLSGALALLAGWLYFARVHDRAPPSRFPAAAYALFVLAYVAAVLAKTVVFSLPAALLLIVYWRHGRCARRDLALLLPPLAVGVGFGLLTAHLERVHVGARGAAFELGALERVLLAGRNLWFYAGKIVWPHPLSFVYPKATIDPGSPAQYAAPLLALAVVAGLLWWRRRLGRGPLVAALIFGGTLLPALGFWNIWFMRYAPVADHFAYLPSLSLLALLAATAARAAERLARPLATRALAIAVVAVLCALSARRALVFQSDERLWADTLRRNPDAWLAHQNLANQHLRAGRLERALLHARRAAANTDEPEAHVSLGAVLSARGERSQAIAAFERAVAREPAHLPARVSLASELARAGRSADAERQLRAALALDPRSATAHHNLASLLAARRDPAALEHHARAVQLAPDTAVLRAAYGAALQAAGRLEPAVEQLQRALAIDPALTHVRNNLGVALAMRGDLSAAAEQFRTVLAQKPGDRDASTNLKRVLELAARR
jgi:Flp pilus assembly protein TadD